MSRYAFDAARHALIVCWPSGAGDTASTVAEPDSAVPGDQVQHLARLLTDLSSAMWRTYTHPPSAAESLEPNSEGWRREGEREAFARIPDVLTQPNLPHNGGLIQVYIDTEEAAHRVGRLLHTLGDEKLTALIVNDVHGELTAIERAERGDLSGRARQAVALSRAGASPAQVEAADRILHEDPLGAPTLHTDIDPAAAAIAAAHWLQAAADVTSAEAGTSPTQVVIEADNIAALPHRTPTLVLETLARGTSPYKAITALIGHAMAAAEGAIPGLDTIAERIDHAEQTARRHGQGDPRVLQELLGEIRTTPLDPARPAQDLLEDLLAGIHGCWLLYGECAEPLDDDLDIDDDSADDDDLEAGVREQFLDQVRQEATQNRARLL